MSSVVCENDFDVWEHDPITASTWADLAEYLQDCSGWDGHLALTVTIADSSGILPRDVAMKISSALHRRSSLNSVKVKLNLKRIDNIAGLPEALRGLGRIMTGASFAEVDVFHGNTWKSRAAELNAAVAASPGVDWPALDMSELKHVEMTAPGLLLTSLLTMLVLPPTRLRSLRLWTTLFRDDTAVTLPDVLTESTYMHVSAQLLARLKGFRQPLGSLSVSDSRAGSSFLALPLGCLGVGTRVHVPQWLRMGMRPEAPRITSLSIGCVYGVPAAADWRVGLLEFESRQTGVSLTCDALAVQVFNTSPLVELSGAPNLLVVRLGDGLLREFAHLVRTMAQWYPQALAFQMYRTPRLGGASGIITEFRNGRLPTSLKALADLSAALVAALGGNPAKARHAVYATLTTVELSPAQAVTGLKEVHAAPLGPFGSGAGQADPLELKWMPPRYCRMQPFPTVSRTRTLFAITSVGPLLAT